MAGSVDVGSTNGTSKAASFYNSVGVAASFFGITGVALDASGNVFVGDAGNHLIRKITSVATGVTDQQIGSDALSIYPNPASNILYIKITLQVNGFQIRDMTVVLMSSGYQISNGIDVSSLNHGLYFIQIKTNEGLATIKFAKQ